MRYYARKKLAIAEARRCLAEAQVQAPPVQVNEIAALQGARVVYRPFDGDDVSACLIPTTPPTIGVNARHHKNRQRYSIAHEIGHLILHRSQDATVHLDPNLRPLFRDEESSKGVDRKEIEANTFAAELLMPENFIRKDLELLGYACLDPEEDPVIRDLAKKYQVSLQAMTIRLVNLGLLE